MINRFAAVALLLCAILITACAENTPGRRAGLPSGERKFSAIAYEYNVNLSPQVSSRRFDCTVRYVQEGVIRIVEIKSHIQKKAEPDIIVKIISSNDSVASVVLNAKREKVAEYPRGKFVNENLFTFTGGDESRKLMGSWFVDPDNLMSDFAIRDASGVLLYKETVIYSVK